MGDNADPRKSSVGKLWGGDVGGFAGDVGSGLSDVASKGQKVNEFMLNPIGTTAQAFGGKGNVSDAPSDEYLGEQQAMGQANAAEQAQRAKDKQNQDYLKSQQTMTQGVADEDAFIQARNAARKAKGNSLFGAWG